MERLTSRLADGTMTINRAGSVRDSRSNYMRPADIEAVRRLAAYEDTGLAPEQCAALKEVTEMARFITAEEYGRFLAL